MMTWSFRLLAGYMRIIADRQHVAGNILNGSLKRRGFVNCRYWKRKITGQIMLKLGGVAR